MIGLAAEIDGILPERVLIYGSLPPHARDLDLLVREDAGAALAHTLREWGFVCKGHTLARFQGDSTDAVELVPAAAWRLPPAELDALFRDAIPLEGMGRLVRPHPRHALLILARRVVRAGVVDDKMSRRLKAILTEDPAAFAAARASARAWGASLSLDLLEHRRGRRGRIVRTARVAATAQQVQAGGSTAVGAWAEAAVGLTPRARVPRVVAFSGLDGSGKSTQVRLLAESLEAVDVRVAIAWHRLTFNSTLDWLSRPVKAVIRFGRAAMRPAAREGKGQASEADPRDRPVRGPLLSGIWGTIVAALNGLSHRRTVLKHTPRVDVVLCDRYTLDSWVQLRWLYGKGVFFPVQKIVVRLLSPRPVKTFLLRLPPQVAWERKQDEFSPDALAVQASDYDRFASSVDAVVVDATRPPQELAREIAPAVWLSL